MGEGFFRLFTGASNLIPVLFQNYDIPACHSKYSFLLHCGDDYRAEALRGHRGLDDVGVLPAGYVQDSKVVVYQDCPFAGFFCGRFVLKITPVRVDKCKPCRLFAILFQEGKEGLKKFKVFIFR